MCTHIRLVLAATFTAAELFVITRATVGTTTIISMTTGIVINPSVSRRTTRTCTRKIKRVAIFPPCFLYKINSWLYQASNYSLYL